MRLLTLKQISEMEPGEVIPAVRCTIKEIREPKTGTNQFGDWTIQSLTALDQTAIMQVKIFDGPVYDAAWANVFLQIESSHNDKGKLAGVEVSEYNKRKEIHVKFKQGATISQVTDETPEPAAAPPPAPAKPAVVAPAPVRQAPVAAAPVPQPSTKHPQPAPVTAAAADVRKAINDARLKLGQNANGLILCFDAALYIANEVTAKHSEVTIPLFGPDQVERLAVSLWISLERSGLAVGLPSGPLSAWQKAPPKPVEPEPPQEPDGDIAF